MTPEEEIRSLREERSALYDIGAAVVAWRGPRGSPRARSGTTSEAGPFRPPWRPGSAPSPPTLFVSPSSRRTIVNFADAAQRFLTSPSAHLAPSTRASYATSFVLLARSGLARVEDLTRPRMKRFLAARRDAGASGQTVRRNLAAAQALLRFLEERDEVPHELVPALEAHAAAVAQVTT